MPRWTTYNDEFLKKTYEYIDSCVDSYDEFHKTRGEKSDTFERIEVPKPPSKEGLALHLDVSRKTIYNWEKESEEFSDALDKLDCTSIVMLEQGGLSNRYNAVIAKVRLARLGVSETVQADINLNGKVENTNTLSITALKALSILEEDENSEEKEKDSETEEEQE